MQGGRVDEAARAGIVRTHTCRSKTLMVRFSATQTVPRESLGDRQADHKLHFKGKSIFF